MDKYNEISVEELIYKSLEGHITEEENSAINVFLSESENVAYYNEYLRLFSALKKRGALQSEKQIEEACHIGLAELAFYEKIAPAIEEAAGEEQPELIRKVVYPPRKKHKMSKFDILTFSMSAAAVLFFVLFLRYAPAKSSYDAVIVDSVNTRWADPSKPGDTGSELSLYDGGRWLQGGYVKLLFGDGAEVIIESPSRFEILSGNQLNLISGRAYSTVPERARGFTVSTPNSQVIDLGTEFGVEVLGGSSSVHMVVGKASVLPENGLHTQKPIELTAGHANVIDQNGILQDTRVDAQKFVTDISSKMSMIYRGDKAIQVGIWDGQLSEDLTKDLRTDGRVIHAVNLGPKSVKPATVCGITFNPLPRSGIVTGAKYEEISDKFQSYNGSNQDLASLLTTCVALNDQNQKNIYIQIDDLKVGREYRIQLIFNFPWGWTEVNCYGVNREHMYFTNTVKQAELGLASYRWKANSTTEKINLNSPPPRPGKWNYVNFVGYVVHEVN